MGMRFGAADVRLGSYQRQVSMEELDKEPFFFWIRWIKFHVKVYSLVFHFARGDVQVIAL